MKYYIADTHFGHENIIRLSDRPFQTVEEMDNVMIAKWNEKITENDDVYILGDFSYKGKDPIFYLSQLKGRKHLIIGNHDTRLLKNPDHRQYFEDINSILMVDDGGTQICCCHYPMVEWNGYYHNVLHFYGHVHNTFHNATTQYAAQMPRAFNVGADIIGFTPRTLKEILEGRY